MQALGDKPKSLVVTIIVASIAMVYVFLFFLPGQKAIGELRGELSSKRKYVSQSKQTTSAVNDADRSLELARQFAQEFLSSNSSEDDSASFTEAASESDVSIVRLDPQADVQMETISRSTINIECEGTFASIFELIQRLEEMPTIVWVSELNLEPVTRTEIGSEKDSHLVSENNEIVRALVTLNTFADKAEISD